MPPPPPTQSDLWPTLAESMGMDVNQNNNDDNDFGWDFVSTEEASKSSTSKSPKNKSPVRYNPKILKHCASSPDLRHYDFADDSTTESSVIETESNANDSVVVVSSTPGSSEKPVKRVPSFKDAILLNAEETAKEEKMKKMKEEQARTAAARKNRRIVKTKYVVTEIKTRSQSTPDLKNLVSICELGSDEFGGGGGGGGGYSEQAVLGDTDACEFYARKTHGSKSRNIKEKIRPDEAKRKEIIMFKKDAQRQRQAAAASGRS